MSTCQWNISPASDATYLHTCNTVTENRKLMTKSKQTSEHKYPSLEYFRGMGCDLSVVLSLMSIG